MNLITKSKQRCIGLTKLITKTCDSSVAENKYNFTKIYIGYTCISTDFQTLFGKK